MVTRFFIGLLVTLLAFGPVLGQQVEIFRTVTINNGNSITLGQDFSKVSDLFERAGDGHALKRGLYGGADKIRVHLDADQKVKAIYFHYDQKKDFQTAVKSYESSLGRRAGEENRNLSDIKIRKVFWEDSKTRFELIEREEAGKVKVISILSDRAGL